MNLYGAPAPPAKCGTDLPKNQFDVNTRDFVPNLFVGPCKLLFPWQ